MQKTKAFLQSTYMDSVKADLFFSPQNYAIIWGEKNPKLE